MPLFKKRSVSGFFFVLFVIIIFFSCHSDNDNEPLASQTREKFHTIFSVRIFRPISSEINPDQILKTCWHIADSVEKLTNFYDTTSALSRVNQNLYRYGKASDVPSLLMDVIQKTVELGQGIQFGLDPTIGTVSILWPFGEPHPIPPERKKIKSALRFVNGAILNIMDNTISGEKGQLLDLSSVNKGYAVDQIVNYLKSQGIENAIVDAGGNLAVLWNRDDSVLISIRHPENPGKIILHFLYKGKCGIATSGDYMNVFEYKGKKYHHILDPETGFPSDSASSVTVIAENAFMADGLATGLFVKGHKFTFQWLHTHSDVQVIYIQSDKKKIYVPQNFPYPLIKEASDYEIIYEP